MTIKAVIPIAGLGTRMTPWSPAVPKALLPLVDSAGRLRCVLHWVCAEAASAGVQDVAVIVSPSQRPAVTEYLAAARRLPGHGLPERLELIDQPRPAGFGDAVARARSFVGAGPVMVLLGDHVHLGDAGGDSCAAQVLLSYRKTGGVAMVGMQPVGTGELRHVGVAAGTPVGERLYRATRFAEKPTVEQARRELATAGLPEGQFLAHAGIYIFGGEMMECLDELQRSGRGGEVQLADAQSRLLERFAGRYWLYRIAGVALDTGTPANYARAFEVVHRAGAGG